MSRKFILSKKNHKTKDKAMIAHVNYLIANEDIENEPPESTHIKRRGRSYIVTSIFRRRMEKNSDDADWEEPIRFKFGKIESSRKVETTWKTNNIKTRHIQIISDGRRLSKSEQTDPNYSDYDDDYDYRY